ncbi:MAG: F0F1 ATP synthase subunit alpha, partial [Nitratireductor sp.]|nr:F0F1 ATP synthase subunit alpha [Nitratireductor sp.]
QFSPLKTEEQVVVIFAGVNGYLDKLAVSQVGPFERALLTNMRGENKDILNDIRKEGAITDSIKERLTAAIDAFAKTFA